jgi:cytochrome b subunit of formate dehydrogenase
LQEGIHHDLRTQGRSGTPGCVDCHGSHRIASFRHDRPASAAKCGECHAGLYRSYASSVHGDALVHGESRDVPTCVDCHRAHDTDDPRTAGYRHEVPAMCGRCHANGSIVGKYGLSTDVVKTYLWDFHGSTVSIYREQGDGTRPPVRNVAICTDCHGTHDIRRMSTLGTAEVKALMLRRCRQCHADASVDFPDAWLSHYTPSLSRTPALFVVDWAYRLLLPLILLGMLLHVVVRARHAIARPAGPAQSVRDESVARGGEHRRMRRFPAGRIVEHLVLILLFALLAATGLAQKYHHLDVSQWLLSAIGGLDIARLVHRGTGAALAVLLVVHVVVAAYGATVRRWPLSMLVTPQDLRDAVQATRYGLGVASRPAGSDRYDYKEKFTYWLVLIGVAIMVLSGLMLWFPVAASLHLPSEAIPLAASVHSHQALVVLLLAVAWHVYDAIFSPDEFPLDLSIFTGYASRERTRSGD